MLLSTDNPDFVFVLAAAVALSLFFILDSIKLAPIVEMKIPRVSNPKYHNDAGGNDMRL